LKIPVGGFLSGITVEHIENLFRSGTFGLFFSKPLKLKFGLIF